MIKTPQRGFTLIELVVVIVILGILAAFAVPRFMGLESQARIATVNALAGSVRSASAMAHGVWLANGANGANIRVNGVNLAMTNGYPAIGTIDNMLESIEGFVYVPATGRFNRIGARNPANCFVQYTPAAVNAQGEVIAPVVAVPAARAMAAGC